MKIRFLLITIFFLGISLSGFAQKVKFKKGDVLIDGVKVFEFERRNMAHQASFYNPETKDEVIFWNYNLSGTNEYNGDDFIELFFPEQDIKIETTKFLGRTSKWIIKELISQRVINTEGVIDEKKLQTFKSKYGENVTERTVRHKF